MKIEEFWTQAFLAALGRVAPEQAKIEADEATEISIAHWQSHLYSWGPSITPRWQDQSIYKTPKTYAPGHPTDREVLEPEPRQEAHPLP
ncbi:hypothetical protein V2H26_21725 [Xanthomonas euvesicatoria]|uniref:hypothetical protein n=1 Tax=Xanthomonas citri TaxID=346 RepID=UPI000F80EA05|nr:hypothetical protein [Xanthomonas axonopodis]MEE5092557.1 hypothetical protein [Xanthomonas euvesicatoria]RTE55626.1 hypothetical protein EI541_23005 [Xanthomonas axonopodis pv. eucalyptorum]